MKEYGLKNLEAVLLKYIKATYLPGRFKKGAVDAAFTQKDVNFFARGAAELSESFTSERQNLPKNYFNKKETRSAYLLYFTLTNYAKVIKCLEAASPFISRQDLKVLDVGCGPATAAIACSAFFADRRLFIVGADQNREILHDAKALLSILGNSNHKFCPIHETIMPSLPLRSIKNERFDLIIVANVLNEVGRPNDQLRLCQTLIDRHLTDTGLIIVVDPALQKTTRALMEVRDQLNAQILGPCLHQDPCPMRARNRRDWCHFYIEWHCPESIRKVDHILGIKHDYLKMAYLILKKAGPEKTNDLWRVVSSPLKSKGKCEFVLCGGGRLRNIVRLDKDRSEANAALDRIKRGDIISVATNTDRISKKDAVSIEKPFNA